MCTGGSPGQVEQNLVLRIGFMPQDITGGSREGQGSGPPVGHSALLRDGVTPHAEAHTHDGAGDEDEEDHRRADQEVQEGVEEGASAKDRRGKSLCASARRQLGAGPGWGEGAMQGHQGTLASPSLSPTTKSHPSLPTAWSGSTCQHGLPKEAEPRSKPIMVWRSKPIRTSTSPGHSPAQRP